MMSVSESLEPEQHSTIHLLLAAVTYSSHINTEIVLLCEAEDQSRTADVFHETKLNFYWIYCLLKL